MNMAKEKKEKRPVGRPPRENPKIMRGIKLEPELDARLVNAFEYLDSKDVEISLTSIIISGLERELTRLEKLHNDGKPFPPPPPKTPYK